METNAGGGDCLVLAVVFGAIVVCWLLFGRAVTSGLIALLNTDAARAIMAIEFMCGM